MENKILHFIDFDWKTLENIKNSFVNAPEDFSSFETNTNDFFEKAKQNFMEMCWWQ